MENTGNKSCPFNREECNKECELYIDPDDFNEVVRNKLASIGVIDRDKGICSFKNLALSMNRLLYEGLSGFLK